MTKIKRKKNRLEWHSENGVLLLAVAYPTETEAKDVKASHIQFCFKNGKPEFGYGFDNLFHYNQVFTEKSCRKVSAEVIFQQGDTAVQRYHKEREKARRDAPEKWYVHYDGVLSWGRFREGVDFRYEDDEIFESEIEAKEFIKKNYKEWL